LDSPDLAGRHVGLFPFHREGPTMIFAALTAYLIGCISPGYLLVRWRTAHDIRQQGSGSTGARNVGRILGRGGFILVFLADCLKGAVAVGSAGMLGAGDGGLLVAMLAAVIGHMFPVQLGFRGGKGASTALGALLVIDAGVAAAALLLCAALYAVVRRATASGLVVFVLLPAIGWALGQRWPGTAALAALSLLLLAAHRDNVADLARALRSAPLRGAHHPDTPSAS
jgi:acyl phosphate:glycerol-3-phosphate acyltransferase